MEALKALSSQVMAYFSLHRWLHLLSDVALKIEAVPISPGNRPNTSISMTARAMSQALGE